MEHKKSQWKIQVCKGAAWIFLFSALALADFPLPSSAFAQETNRKLKSGPAPEYPELARRLNIKGSVRIQFTITRDGRVTDVKELGGNPVLLSALVDAVKKWKYEPAPAETKTEVKFDFQ